VVPPPLQRKPSIKKGDEVYLVAFNSCSHARQPGGMGGPSPILISEVLSYLNLAGIDSHEERLKYLRTIQQLDSVYLTDAAERMQKNNKKPS
jgi:hypothetical protein